MEFESLHSKHAKEYVVKRFGDKEPELKSIVQMDLSLDEEDPDDVAKKEKILKKMKREHEKDIEILKGYDFLIHDSSGNLVPFKIS